MLNITVEGFLEESNNDTDKNFKSLRNIMGRYAAVYKDIHIHIYILAQSCF